MEYNQENNESENTDQDLMEEDENPGKFKQWFRDNLRILISVLIVVVIAGGIYSYSKRSEVPAASEETQKSEVLGNITDSSEEKTATDQKQENAQGTVKEEKTETQNKTPQAQTSSVATSQETEKSFIETAAKGDSQTKLARRALANYLEKSPDSSLTPEHKIYIEDYLRKNVPQKGRVHVGTSVEFGKDLIQNAISKSKTLNDSQLKNLHKYAVRVPSLS
jgi:hypothetical protein